MPPVLAGTLRLLDRLVEWVVILMMVALVIIVSLQFVDRHFIDTGIAAPDQYARVALVWLTFIGFAIAVRSAVNVRVDLIDARLPPKVRTALEVVFDVLLLVLTGALVPGCWRVMEVSKDQELLGTVFTASVPAAGAFIMCVLLLFYVGLRLIARLLGWKMPMPEEV